MKGEDLSLYLAFAWQSFLAHASASGRIFTTYGDKPEDQDVTVVIHLCIAQTVRGTILS